MYVDSFPVYSIFISYFHFPPQQNNNQSETVDGTVIHAAFIRRNTRDVDSFEIIRRFSLNLKNSRWRTTWRMKWMRCCCPWLKKKFQMEGKLLWTVTKIFLCYQIIVKKTISIGQQIFTFLFSFFLTVSGCCIMQRISKATLNFQGSNFGRRSCVIVILF